MVLKQHPNKPLDIEKYLNRKYIYQISKKDMLDEIIDTNILVTQFKTSATVYGPLYKLPTISWLIYLKEHIERIKIHMQNLVLLMKSKI